MKKETHTKCKGIGIKSLDAMAWRGKCLPSLNGNVNLQNISAVLLFITFRVDAFHYLYFIVQILEFLFDCICART
jgi:hypothetical protein